MVLPCPSQLNDTAVINFLAALKHNAVDPELIIDFTSIIFATPFASLLLAEGLHQLVRARKPNGLPTLAVSDVVGANEPAGLSYLKHVGFFRFVGLTIGNPPNAPGLGNSNYIPIRLLRNQDLQSDAKPVVIQEAIEREGYRFANMLVERETPESGMLAYCFREVVRNTFEHAEIDHCTYMAQKWNSGKVKGDVEIAIIDCGRGILASMRESYDVELAEQAIILALRPGVSRIRIQRRNDRWANSGYGLYVLSQIGTHYGEFAICSSGTILRLHNGEQEFQDIDFDGTAIKIRVNLRDAEYFPNFLKMIVDQGEAEAFQKIGERRSASQKSKVL